MPSSPSTVESAENFDSQLLSDDFYRDPYPILGKIRDAAPIYASSVLKGWLVSRYEDVDEILRDTATFSNAEKMARYMSLQPPELRSRTEPLIELLDGNSMSMQDPPRHTRLRKVASAAFLPSRIARLRSSIATTAHALLDQVEGGDGADLVAALTDPLPRLVLTDFLGVDRSDAGDFAAWTEAVRAFLISPHTDGAVVDHALKAFGEMSAFVEEQVQRRHADPAMDDVIAIMARAMKTEDATHAEVLATCVQIVFAGAGTTTSLIGSALLSLLRHPEQLERVRADRNLVAAAVEETLRAEPPVTFAFRVAIRDVEIAGARIPEGDTVVLSLAGANHDPAVFDHPERFDLDRKRMHHFAFGLGAHLCIGAVLARLQGDVAINAVLDRHAALRLVNSEPDWLRSFELRELTSLPVSW